MLERIVVLHICTNMHRFPWCLDYALSIGSSATAASQACACILLQLTMEQFIDLCILCGCDYTDSIKGIGPVEYPVSPLSPMSHAAISPPAREVRICPPIPNGELTTACK